MIVEYVSPIANHIWQSTLFAAAAGLLTLALRNGPAAVRHRIWLAASVKFLIPFFLLIVIGSRWQSAPETPHPQVSSIVLDIGRPFAPAAAASQPLIAPRTKSLTAPILLSVWLSGFTVCILAWLRDWLRIRRAVRCASPIRLDFPAPALASPRMLGPAIFGIFRPVLLLPEGISERLMPSQFHAILAHELCHLRRRDNLAAAIHAFVQAVFWFHPLVWWIGSQLAAERERACDEEVLRNSVNPRVYAEGILTVCKFSRQPAASCVSSVAGPNLKRRIEEIMTRRRPAKLTVTKKLLLCVSGLAAVAGPILFGIWSPPMVWAQPQAGAVLTFEAASIKPNKSGDLRGTGWGSAFLPGGRLSATNIPPFLLIAMAYDVGPQSVRLSGGPPWIRSERYDVEATAGQGVLPASMPPKDRDEKMRSMLQALLADRFKLAVRRENSERPVYAVVIGKGGPKLQTASMQEKDCPEGPENYGVSCHSFAGGMGRGLHAKAVTIADVAKWVENWSDRPVVDKTGLDGLYEVETDGWAPMRPRPLLPGHDPTPEDIAMADPTRPTLSLIFERMGLKLEAQKAPVDVFVIEHVERPSEN